MESGKIIVGFILLIFGLLNVVKPEIYINFQTYIFKTIYGATFKPSEKTVRINKYFGFLFVLLGLVLLVY